jgi:predicted RNase H-like HicB family nuclease
MKKYLIIFEKTKTGYSAYSPDIDGCIAAGNTMEDAEKKMQEAIEFHFEGMKEMGLVIPEPHSSSAYLAIAV